MSHFCFKKGFTLIEALITMVIVALLAGTGLAGLFRFFADSLFVLPKKTNVDLILHSISQAVIEGSPLARGLRYAEDLSIIEANELSFNNKEGQYIKFKIEEGRLKMSIDQEDFKKIPYYIDENILISGEEEIGFRYLDRKGNPTLIPSEVGKIFLSLEAWQKGKKASEIETSIAIRAFKGLY